jgi:23S rRNA (adenine2503-C2)-methyltransferase
VNDTDALARELANILDGIPAKINLIPFNPWAGSGYETSTDERVGAFARILEKAGYDAPVRRPRGRDILAACGQLKSASVKIRKTSIEDADPSLAGQPA